MINNFFTPFSVAIIIIIVVFLILTRKSWNIVVKKLVVQIRNKWFIAKTPNQEKQGSDKDGRKSNESKKVKKLFQNLNVKNFDELGSLVNSYKTTNELSRKQIEDVQKEKNTFFDLWKFYMFSYLDLYLVFNSKGALLWFYNNPNSTKDMFKLQLYFPPQIVNHELEKETIFLALVSNYLIQKDQRDLYSITNIGRDFLIFINYIKQL